jgi:hypothetical protein
MQTVTIPRDDWDKHKLVIAQLFDAHEFIRKVLPTVREHGDAELNMDADHFEREYLPIIWTVQ